MVLCDRVMREEIIKRFCATRATRDAILQRALAQGRCGGLSCRPGLHVKH